MATGLGIGGHTLPNQGETTIWLTPPELLEKLGRFDLDPCAAPYPRPWDTARHHIEPPEDGLKAEWFGRVWLNPPYSQNMGPWMAKMACHKSGLALIFARTETDTWHEHIWPKAHSILFLEGRLYFRRPDGSKPKSNAGGPSALISYSVGDTLVLEGLVGCEIPGKLVKLK